MDREDSDQTGSTCQFVGFVVRLKFEHCGLIIHPKDEDELENSVDPFKDCSFRGSLIWVYTGCTDLSVPELRIIAINLGLIKKKYQVFLKEKTRWIGFFIVKNDKFGFCLF